LNYWTLSRVVSWLFSIFLANGTWISKSKMIICIPSLCSFFINYRLSLHCLKFSGNHVFYVSSELLSMISPSTKMCLLLILSIFRRFYFLSMSYLSPLIYIDSSWTKFKLDWYYVSFPI
jgi:hypothetical protein